MDPSLPTIFSSGSCRLLLSITDGREIVRPIHVLFRYWEGINFLGKLHNTKQHLQFLRWLKGEQLPPDILSGFLTTFSEFQASLRPWSPQDIEKSYHNIRNQLDTCDIFAFEVCSMKLYERNGYQVQYELTNDYVRREQTDEELANDLVLIRKMIPSEKPIIFTCNFRPNIIHGHPSLGTRDRVFQALETFCRDGTNNSYLIDPSVFLRNNPDCYNGEVHFTKDGYKWFFSWYLAPMIANALKGSSNQKNE